MHNQTSSTRRWFLAGAAGAAAAIPLLPNAAPAAPADAAAKQAGAAEAANDAAPAGYQSFGPAEAAFVEAMVNVMCPADALTPNGVDCGLALFIDRQLAGGFGKGDRWYAAGPWPAAAPQFGIQSPLSPEQFFKAGLRAANDACSRLYRKTFDQLAPADANAFLTKVSASAVLGQWFNDLVYPLFVQACFADPMYGGNRAKVFWKLIGYPGLPAFHTQDMTAFRGKPFTAAPQSIQDFS
jgi:gluconate 2-dehydrogenase gamma chain